MDKVKSSRKTGGLRHHASYVPKLSLTERERRWQLLREYMLMEGLDCLLLVGNDVRRSLGMVNMRYITQIGSSQGGFAVFPLRGEPVVWVGNSYQVIPFSRYRYTQDWVKDIRANEGPGPVVKFLKDNKYERSKIGIVGFTSGVVSDIIPFSTWDYIHKELPYANIINATGLVNYLRLIKSPEEISMLENAGKIARKTLDTFIQSAEPGKKECELYADLVHTLISNGGEASHIFFMLTSGPIEGSGNEKQLLHGCEAPAVPSTRILERGDLILFEFHVSYAGYLSAAEFSLCLGEPPAQWKRIHDVAVQCFTRLRETMKPGFTFREALEAEREPCRRAGMDYLELGFHQHGLDSVGPLSALLKPGSGPLDGDKIGDLEIRENMIFGTNTDIHDPNWKKDVGLMLGDTLHITKDGNRCLVNTPLDIMQK